MDVSQLDQFRGRLMAALKDLEAEDSLGQAAQETVKLDQQSVGRLSRMDALQQQAMAKATKTRRANARLRILAALQRMEEDEFGYCQKCGEEILRKRLELDPTVPSCINCAP